MTHPQPRMVKRALRQSENSQHHLAALVFAGRIACGPGRSSERMPCSGDFEIFPRIWSEMAPGLRGSPSARAGRPERVVSIPVDRASGARGHAKQLLGRNSRPPWRLICKSARPGLAAPSAWDQLSLRSCGRQGGPDRAWPTSAATGAPRGEQGTRFAQQHEGEFRFASGVRVKFVEDHTGHSRQSGIASDA